MTTPEEARQMTEQLVAQVGLAVVVCMRPDQVDWVRLPATIAQQLQHTPCADCQTDLVWSPRSSPAEPLKVCEPCAKVRIAHAPGPMIQTMYVGPERTPPPVEGQHRA